MRRMHGGQSSSSTPASAMLCCTRASIRLRTMPMGRARRDANSSLTSATFSRASASMPALMRSLSRRATLADELYWASLWSRMLPSDSSVLAKRQRSPVIFGHTSMKSAMPMVHSRCGKAVPRSPRPLGPRCSRERMSDMYVLATTGRARSSFLSKRSARCASASAHRATSRSSRVAHTTKRA